MNLIDIINNFKKEVEYNGMKLDEYLKNTKKIKYLIDLKAENKINILKYLLYIDNISLDEYKAFKSKIEANRKHYKTMLASI